MTDGHPLTGGRSRVGVVLVGSTVRRPQTARSPYSQAVLRRLEVAGVDGVPRFLGVDDRDREILSYLPGDTVLDAGRPIGLIDFDDARGSRADDLAYLLWVFLDLGTTYRHTSRAGGCGWCTTRTASPRCVSQVLPALERQQQRILEFRTARPDPFSAGKVEEIRAAMDWASAHRADLIP